MAQRIHILLITLIVSFFGAKAEETDSVVASAPKSRIVRTKVDLENPVDFTSTDSTILIGRNIAWMYGNGKVNYGNINLSAQVIEMDLQTNLVAAAGVLDSVGNRKGTPVFSQGSDSYASEEMTYNFKTERGYITNVVTQQGEGYLSGGKSKRLENGEFYIQDGKYTTCDNQEHPHFHLQITKGKVKPGSNIVTGPAYMVVAGLPLPVALPFGYFPFTKKYSSGIILPTVGDDYRRGFYLDHGGYYFAINDYVDATITGQLYSRGSWGVSTGSNYSVRYKYAGNLQASFLRTIDGEKGSPDYATGSNFQVTWSHQQDSKYNPNLTLAASVNFATSGYSRSNVNSYYSNNFTENTKSSTVNLSYRFPNSKWRFDAAMNINQRSSDETLSMSLPSLNWSMSQTAPFKRKKAVGAERWYEKIKISYSGQFSNSLTAKQNEFLHKSLIKDWRNGMRHSLPINATFQLLKYINVTPSLSINDRMYTSKVTRSWDPNAAAEVCDTTYGFHNLIDFNASMSMSTKLYGFWQPLIGKKIKMIRHVLSPSVNFSASPDFGTPFWGYYGSYDYTDARGQRLTKEYSYYANSLYGTPGRGKSGIVSFSLANNLEMKVKSDNDSTGERKISLIENLSLSQSYNLAADSLRWSNINSSILLRLTKSLNLNLSAVWDVYTYKLNSYGTPVRCNVTRLEAGKGLGRLSSTGTSFSYSINNSTFSKLLAIFQSKPESDDDADGKSNEQAKSKSKKSKKSQSDSNQFSPEGYLEWSVPWNLSFNYSVSYGYGAFDYKKLEYKGKLTQNLSFSGSIKPTSNWNLAFSASYNFDLKKIAYMNCNVTRDLHCWSLTASFVPIGPYKSYNVHIGVNASMLSDLKYDKRSSYAAGLDWY